MTSERRRKSKTLKRFSACALVLQTLMIVSSLQTATTVHAAEDDWHYVKSKEDCGKDESKESSGSLETPNGVAGDWLTEGTETYKVAKKIFDVFTKEYGTSGAFAAGVLANAFAESGFRPDVMEGGVRVGMNTPDGPSYNSANPGAVGGGGLFQFTPYTKFSHSKWWKGRSGSDGWGR